MKTLGLVVALAALPQDAAPPVRLEWGPDAAKKYAYKTVLEYTFKGGGNAKVEIVEEIERLATMEDGTIRIGSRTLSVDMTWTAGGVAVKRDWGWNAGAWSSGSGEKFPYSDSPGQLRNWVELTKNHWLFAMSKTGKIRAANVFGSLKAMREGARKETLPIWPETAIPYHMLELPSEPKKAGEPWEEITESAREAGGHWMVKREGKVVAWRTDGADLEFRKTTSIQIKGKSIVDSIFTVEVSWNLKEGMPRKTSLVREFPQDPLVTKIRSVSELTGSGPKDP